MNIISEKAVQAALEKKAADPEAQTPGSLTPVSKPEEDVDRNLVGPSPTLHA